MSDGGYGGSAPGTGPGQIKVWNRAEAILWDEKWHRLTPGARRGFLEHTKGPSRAGSINRVGTPAEQISPAILAELVEAGFAEVEKAAGKKGPKAYVPTHLNDFTVRIRTIHRYHLLGPDDRAMLAQYCRYVFQSNGELSIARVLARAKVDDPCRLDAAIERYVASARWPEWAAEATELPLAQPLVQALIKAPGPIRLADLPRKVPGPAAAVEAALAGMIDRVAAFEDLDPESFDIVVGLLPVVRERIEAARKPRSRPPLVAVEKPRGLGPPSGLLANDLRVFLLELVGQPPRLRQDGELFSKEEPRFLEAFPAWPDWLVAASRLDPPARLGQAHDWAEALKFVEKDNEEDRTRLLLSAKGRDWLAADLEAQYAAIYEFLRAVPNRRDSYYYYEDETSGDALFLGIRAMVATSRVSRYPSYSYDLKATDRQALRESLSRSLTALPVGRYVTLESVLAHLTFREHNPLVLGRKDPSDLTILVNDARIPQIEDRIENAGQVLLSSFLLRRLVLCDALAVAIDDEGLLCVARLPRLDGYFGRKYKAEKAGKADGKVIVQPDFSIVVIGLDPAPAVELAPFCDRAQGQAGQGAMIFKLTRESVIRAVAQGMKGAEIVARLNRHASVAVPANVLSEVREWADWTRRVNVRPMTVVRCPDPETVARVVAALGRNAEKLGDTLVGLASAKLSSADRAKLTAQGIIITKDPIAVAGTAGAKAKVKAAAPKKRGRPRRAE
ncbi:helicase-associated domain-containing protein [Tundrisphaera sp. TA3]|uniref:helicase-associated domain-containing protein n=1 Tax=Tundrisphaera sp. TA3 TaxID=3435775 RepID=UPI003EC0FB36